MSEVTDVTKSTVPSVVNTSHAVALDEYISYCALGGILTDDDGTTRKMTVDQFCQVYGVTRMTLSRWKRQIPDWGERVSKRRDEIMPNSRVTHVWNSAYLIARQTQDKRAAVEAQKLILGHFGLVLPVQRQQVELKNNAAELLTAAKEEGIIEGEVVHDTDHAGADGQDPGALPFPS